MKKIQILNQIKALSLFGISMILSVGFAKSQERYEVASNHTNLATGTAGASPKADHRRMNEIHANAVRHYLRNYPDAANAQWHKSGTGYQVKFLEKGQECLAIYTEKGLFRHTVRFLDESVLHPSVLKKIRKDFPEYATDIVAEILTENKKQFLVTLKNNRSMKSLVIDQQAITVIDELEYILQ